MASFKQHASFGYWKHALVGGGGAGRDGMGSYGKLAGVGDLPPRRQLLAHIRRAMELNEQGVKAPAGRKAATPRPMPEMPPELAAALAMRKHAGARKAFDAFAPSHRREYIRWITGTRGRDTRARRLQQALEWPAEGKTRHWKYAQCGTRLPRPTPTTETRRGGKE